MVGPTELFALPRGHAFALLDGGRLWKLRIPMPDTSDPLLPNSIHDAFEYVHINKVDEVKQNELEAIHS